MLLNFALVAAVLGISSAQDPSDIACGDDQVNCQIWGLRYPNFCRYEYMCSCNADDFVCSENRNTGDCRPGEVCVPIGNSPAPTTSPTERTIDPSRPCGCEQPGVFFCNHDFGETWGRCQACDSLRVVDGIANEADCYSDSNGLPDLGAGSCAHFCFLTAAYPSVATTPVPTTNPAPTTSPTNAFGECARNCGQTENGGGTCRDNGRCTACNDDRVLQSGRCYVSIACKGRRIQSGSQAGSSCRCLDDHCHYCNRDAGGDTCRVCRDGFYLLDDACVEACPAGLTSLGIGSFKRRCLAPFSCANGRIQDQNVAYGCKCATDDMAAAACQNCEFRADEVGQHCTKCNGGKFLFENRCQDSCDGTGLIAYNPGNYGRECRAPFTCTDRTDEDGNDCKCPRAVGRNNCQVCDYGSAGARCVRCTNSMYLHRDLHGGVCVEACPGGGIGVGDARDGRVCA